MLVLPKRPGFVQLGLKAAQTPKQLMNRLQYRPKTFEFFTSAADFEPDAFKNLKTAITFVAKNVTTDIVVHHPMSYQGIHLDQLLDPQRETVAYNFLQKSTSDLLDLATDLNIRVLIHGGYGSDSATLIKEYESITAARETVFARLDTLVRQGNGHVMIENGITPSFMYGDPQLDEQIIHHQLPLVCDISHVFIGLHGDMELTMLALKRLKPLIKHYHLVDSLGQQHDSLPLGTGLIDWQRVLGELNPTASMIYEVPDETDATCANMLSSYHYLRNLETKLIESRGTVNG
ncbi:sugar phosphate isomerase/epimerase [Lactobacillus sp.] [Lactiplantibacillus mudanjiangensis]|uniref:TIM barrel protein n=1 Tax=Lactiplantibacillus mudanjiangensis TaxID=1296538 RepID=UPI0010152B0A|nr:TIM barrel protein [Lactiplantibacillus mudanjiangensis]VDG33314.1 sugar phosphate isomerase/epimerase [Lactobacillus sp.] [Lactiplantibacillus mudanjiangensis]